MNKIVRTIIQIDKDKCNGCGICVNACHESAIGMVDGKAKLLRDDYCDGLGNCLPACPTGAISFVEREALPYDDAGIHMNTRHNQPQPGRLAQWPVQMKLVPVTAPYYDNANLLIAADCAAYAYGSFHNDFIKNRITLIGCPKLDDTDYTDKLTEIIRQNNIKSLTIVRMVVPCCGGLEIAAKNALQKSGKFLPWQVVSIDLNGGIVA